MMLRSRVPWQGGTQELRDSEFVLREELTEIVKSGRPGDDKIPGMVLGVGS